jgi:hypothetical protein
MSRELKSEKHKYRKSPNSKKHHLALILTRGSLITNGRVTQNFRKEKMRSNNSNDGNYLLLWGILSKLMSSNVL